MNMQGFTYDHINVATPLLYVLNPYTSNLNKADCMGQGIVITFNCMVTQFLFFIYSLLHKTHCMSVVIDSVQNSLTISVLK